MPSASGHRSLLSRIFESPKCPFSQFLKKRRRAQKNPFGQDVRVRASARDKLVGAVLWKLRSISALAFAAGLYLLLCFDQFSRNLIVDEHGFSHGVHHSTFVDDAQIFRIRNAIQEAAQEEARDHEELMKTELARLKEEAKRRATGSGEGSGAALTLRSLLKKDCLPLKDAQATAYPFLYLPETLFVSSCEQDELPISSFDKGTELLNRPPRFLCRLLHLLSGAGLEVYLQPFLLQDEGKSHFTDLSADTQHDENVICGTWHYNLIAISKSDRGDSRDALGVFTSFDYSLLHLPSLVASSSYSTLPSVPGAGSVAAVSSALSVFLQHAAPWLSRDVFFVFSDFRLPYSAGSRAWLSAYIRSQSFFPRRGLLRMAVALEPDREGTEREEGFRFLSPDIEGTDGRLPNQDIVNVFMAEAARTGVAVKLRNTWEYVFRMARNWGAHRPHSALLEEAIPTFTIVARTGGGRGRVASDTPLSRWGDLARVLERLTRSESNVLQTLHHSFNFYFYASSHAHVSSGAFLYPVFTMLALLLIPILSSRVMRDIRGFLAAIALLLLAFACSLPALILATRPSVNSLLFGDPHALVPSCASWQRDAYLQYSQKASIWLQVLFIFYFLLLTFVMWLGRRINAQRTAAGEGFPASLGGATVTDPAILWETPKREKTEDEKEKLREARRLADALERVQEMDRKKKEEKLVASGSQEQKQQAHVEDPHKEEEPEEEDEEVEAAWQPPRAPPPLWLSVRGFCVRVFAVWIIVMLTLYNWGLSAFLSCLMVPMAWLVVPLGYRAAEPPRPFLEENKQDTEEKNTEKKDCGEDQKGEDEELKQAMAKWRKRCIMVKVATLLRKVVVAVVLLGVLLFVFDSDVIKVYRTGLQQTAQELASSVHEALSTLQTEHLPWFSFLPLNFLEWLRAGSVFRPLSSSPPQYPLDSSSLSSTWGEPQALSRDYENHMRALLPLGSAWLFPQQPTSFLLFLYSMARDSVCVNTANFATFLFGLLPFSFFLVAVFLVLPP
ncbi:putative glycosylphosphatidylinositol anchor attachment protein 1 [Toxoplasma gondii RUB]|uniref:Glycosylphosphatidylinositol anchor attachment 1 protein, putative n=8 Tax=Toxoplasma gondii TaxID=5811 RepID=V4Z774_TOXGV|nr:putative glycosylphosphatidylinositol anchor attachment protein 1 [Toxoplasma gondii VEG]KFG31086.1 putative glycosylphosphatidylinositol anchor attachment protein 1 [Toxoplasma gondii GAB2-2007-GAL-DOM2]KFG43608.1 putative glycosylphosphatidylinositol anchor attachment protein 1 [Toxoplasma gondii p89]KFG43902.1 putative glycosylphosphatidylinositol anchor attachment protein 1 [Toxoplasma gondii FOU]KFG58664.1 putative glycosylphosphatidylinositol anchor attachment protein 1 [Toxoplasma gon